MNRRLLLEAAFTIYRRWVGLDNHRTAVRKAYEFMERVGAAP